MTFSQVVSYSILALFVLLLFSCKKDKTIEPLICDSQCYLHLSHTRTSSNPAMDGVAENIDFNKFDMLWLGGDLAYSTSTDDATMNHVDSKFNIGDSNTLWALGNHDYANLNKVEQYSNRPPFYSIHKDGITIVVLDTQDSLSNIVDSQKIFLMGILDTIQESTHLILLHHKLVWMYGESSLEPQISSISNAGLGSCFNCLNQNNFNAEIYPELVTVKQSGIEVLCVAGDIGSKTNQFEHLTADGIHFLASGINSGGENNKALLFHHDPSLNSLTWEFKLLTHL